MAATHRVVASDHSEIQPKIRGAKTSRHGKARAKFRVAMTVSEETRGLERSDVGRNPKNYDFHGKIEDFFRGAGQNYRKIELFPRGEGSQIFKKSIFFDQKPGSAS